jgi:4-diphosphocytidyl-2-C-methyl-D-erythritol kinase
MAESIRVRAAAKINLHLRVYRRRADGYHGIRSLFQAVSLEDTIVIRSLKESDTIEIDGEFNCPIRSTTIYQAASAFLKESGSRVGLSILVEKRIPAGAGLGGGSSDAAATLVGLNALLGGGLGEAKLHEIGAAIGSDVPFFLSSGTAIVSGRGEEVRPFPGRSDYSVVIVDPGFAVSTAEAYALLDRERPDDSGEADPGSGELIEAYGGDIGSWPFANSFEPIVGGSRRPEIPRIKDLLLRDGASFAAMSGSGSSVFGIFEGRTDKALATMARAGYAARSAIPLARCPALD